MIRPSFDIDPAADADLREQFAYLRSNFAGDETLRSFTASVREALVMIETNPRTWSFAPRSKRVRKVQISRFRMQVFYYIQKNGRPLIIEFAGPGLQPRWRERL